MFVLSWIRSSDAQASNVSASSAIDAAQVTETGTVAGINETQHQDDWVFLPSDHSDLMESSVSDLDLLSASMNLYRPSSTAASSTHPASSRRSRTDTVTSTTSTVTVPDSLKMSTTAASTTGTGTGASNKSKRQLKREMRQKQALEELERQPRYDPMIAKMRDHEFKMAKMSKMGLRSGRIMSSGTGDGSGSGLKASQSSAASKAC